MFPPTASAGALPPMTMPSYYDLAELHHKQGILTASAVRR
jgi:hypothetical protein